MGPVNRKRKEAIAAKHAADPRKDLALENLTLREEIQGLRERQRDYDKNKKHRDMVLNKHKAEEVRAIARCNQLEELLYSPESKMNKLLKAADENHRRDEKFIQRLNRIISVQQQLIYALTAEIEYDGRTRPGTTAMKYDSPLYKEKVALLERLIEELEEE